MVNQVVDFKVARVACDKAVAPAGHIKKYIKSNYLSQK